MSFGFIVREDEAGIDVYPLKTILNEVVTVGLGLGLSRPAARNRSLNEVPR